MSRIAKYLFVPVIAVASVLATNASRVEAGGFSINIGTGGFGYPGYGVARYSSGFQGYGRNYGYASGFRSFNTGPRVFAPVVHPRVVPRYGVGYRGYSGLRLSPLAPVVVPNRGFYHYQPGHYNLYRGRR